MLRGVRDDACEARDLRPGTHKAPSGRSPGEARSLRPSSLPQGSCALPHSPWRSKFLAAVFPGILLCVLIAFMIKIMTTAIYRAPTTCQALSERFMCTDLLNPCNCAMRQKYYYFQFTSEETKAQECFILLPLKKQATGLRGQPPGYPVAAPLTVESFVELIRKKIKKSNNSL